MHDIEPYWRWRDLYSAEEDELSPFYGKEYSELHFTHAIYDHVIHPQWDEIGSPTLFVKLLFVDYDDGFAIIEMIGEWNDILHNDIMFFKREVIDVLIANGIYRFMLIGENVLNFHGDGNDYYEEWWSDIENEGGWIIPVNFTPHVVEEFYKESIHDYFSFSSLFSELNWRKVNPDKLMDLLEQYLFNRLA